MDRRLVELSTRPKTSHHLGRKNMPGRRGRIDDLQRLGQVGDAGPDPGGQVLRRPRHQGPESVLVRPLATAHQGRIGPSVDIADMDQEVPQGPSRTGLDGGIEVAAGRDHGQAVSLDSNLGNTAFQVHDRNLAADLRRSISYPARWRSC